MGRGYCFGCMEVIDAYPCPYCGHSAAVEDKPYALRAGTILKGRYLVGKILGQGGFGITYIGMDLQLQRKLAIKEYYPSSYACRQDTLGTVHWYSKEVAQEARMSGRELFLKEARKMSRVSHIPEVVQVYDLFQENDTAYICMDYIAGITLMNRLKEKGPMSWEEAKHIFLPAMAVLDQVHKAGLVHRDISPDNIMLQRDGSIRILDLGAAKDLQVNSGQSSMQVAKSGFSPPEQYMQRGNSGSWTDVYAMAATMYYALTGKLPLPAMDRMNPEGDTLSWELPQLQMLPESVKKALKHALVLRISERTQTMEDFARELTEVQVSNPSPTKNPAAALTTVVVVLMLMAGVFFGKTFFSRSDGNNISSETIFTKQQESIETTASQSTEMVVKPISAAAGKFHTVILMSDGTVKAFGDNRHGECDVSQWTDIVAVSADLNVTFGIRRDGKVVVAGTIESGEKQSAISKWSDIVAIHSVHDYTVALKADGSVVIVGDIPYNHRDVSAWMDVVALVGGMNHTVGLRSDGTVVVAGYNSSEECLVDDWCDIKAISAGINYTVGLKADGTVVATGYNANGECDVSQWKNIVSIGAGNGHTVGVTNTGDVLAVGWNEHGQCDVSGWENVVSVTAGNYHTIGLTADGKVLATGNNTYGQCDIDLSQ